MSRPILPILPLAAVVLAAALCIRPLAAQAPAGPGRAAKVSPRQTSDPSPHRAGVVNVGGVRIEYLDWGGTGPALLFIPGMGNSAHVFDEFAPRFTNRHRVVGVTRVGYGGSDRPERDAYGVRARIEHIRAVMDRLGLARAVLVGHSLGGDELTAFAGAYPGRTAGLVYLDAAYDRKRMPPVPDEFREVAAKSPQPTTEELAGVLAFERYQDRLQGFHVPIGEALATTEFDSAGALVGHNTPPRVGAAIRDALESPDYSRVRAPALAIYADLRTASDMLPWLRADPAVDARITALLRERLFAYRADRERFAREVKGARVVALRAHHYLFITHAREVERHMRGFLATIGR